MVESCCTCATLLSDITPLYDEKTEKPLAQDRRLDCCGRVICGPCIHKNARFGTYCPFCQISSIPTPLPQGQARGPPLYTPPRIPLPTSTDDVDSDEPPSYTSLSISPPPHISPTLNEKSAPAQDVLHFLVHPHDTVSSLSLRYAVPAAALRRVNNLSSDHLLLARRTVLIPGDYYTTGVSLSPRPAEGEEEEARKGKIRRWMVGCKVVDVPARYRYDVALLYLEQADYDLDAAIEAYKDDERWETEHPIEGSIKGKGRTRYDLGRRRYTGQQPWLSRAFGTNRQ